MIDYNELLNSGFAQNSVRDYLVGLFVFFLMYFLLRIFKHVGLKKLKKIASITKTEVDDFILRFIDNIHWLFYVIISLYIALKSVVVPDTIMRIMYYILLIGITFYIVTGITKVISFSTKIMIQRKKREDKDVDELAAHLVSKLAIAIIWLFAVLFVLSNLGYDITTLIAGLGIGGIAIGLALQNILGDIFASFSIFLDKPFQIGDFIIIGNDMGVVNNIGIKSTRIQTLQGQELVVSNKELTETRVNNYKKMEKRRIVFNFGVTYDTSVSKLKTITQIVADIIKKQNLATLDRVHFRNFGDFSLDYEVVYYLDSNDYTIYMNTQQEINLALKEKFENEKIEFAFPTQTVFVNKGRDSHF